MQKGTFAAVFSVNADKVQIGNHIEHLGNRNPRMHTDELLITLAICAVTNPIAGTAIEELSSLRGCEAHSSVILSHTDAELFKKIGVNLTFEPRYQAQNLYHK